MIISFTGPSGVGKGFLKRKLIEAYPDVKELSWATTRLPRDGETGRVCMDDEAFARILKSGGILFDHELYGSRYGLLVSEIDPRGSYVTELHVSNVSRASSCSWEIYRIAVLPEDIKFLETRLRDYRATETEDEIRERLAAAEDEIARIHTETFECVFRVSQANENMIAVEMLRRMEQVLKGAGQDD